MRKNPSWATRLRWLLLGYPISSKHAYIERIPNYLALSIFASDALSSVAYATEEIMISILGSYGWKLSGIGLLAWTVPISIAICILILIVSTSYYQTIQAYPAGGGAYIVAKQNLGPFYGRLAGASLLTAYVLTVAVSVAAGILAVISMVPSLQDYIVPLGVGAILFIMIANLRGVRESGLIFALPTYSFIVLVFGMIFIGFFKSAPVTPEVILNSKLSGIGAISLFALLKAFSSGCTALTGIEAISDGVPVFKHPASRNASKTLAAMAGLLVLMFVGISFLTYKFHVVPRSLNHEDYQTVLALLCEGIFGQGTFFYVLQAMTAGILILAANTAFADFPRLTSFIARDGYLPRMLTNIGDRLVFQNGIILLSALSIFLVVRFHGDVHELIPLYAVSVFLSFTLSQFGMVSHAWREGRRWAPLTISLIGGIVTTIVTIVVLTTRFSEGAWMVPIALGCILWIFRMIRRHYDGVSRKLSVRLHDRAVKKKNTVILLVPRLHRGVLEAISYALSTAKDCRALHVVIDPKSASTIKQEWGEFGASMPLVILESPYRSMIDPIIEYVDQMLYENPDRIITVIVPQALLGTWWHNLLHDNLAVRLKLALSSRRNVVIANVRYFVQ